MGDILELLSTFATPFLQSPYVVLLLALIVIGADAGIFSNFSVQAHYPVNEINWSDVTRQGARGLTYEQAVEEDSIVIYRTPTDYCVKPVLIDTSFLTPNVSGSAIGNPLYFCQKIEPPLEAKSTLFPLTRTTKGSNVFGALLTGFFQMFQIPIKVTSFMLFVLIILGTVGFWCLTALTRP